MNKLACLTLAGLLVGGSIFAQDLSRFGFPTKFDNYREKVEPVKKDEYILGQLMHTHSYDLTGNGRPDVIEIFIHLGYDDSRKPIHPLEPIIYRFDLNENGSLGNGESFFDKKMDGPNGNETYITFGNELS